MCSLYPSRGWCNFLVLPMIRSESVQRCMQSHRWVGTLQCILLPNYFAHLLILLFCHAAHNKVKFWIFIVLKCVSFYVCIYQGNLYCLQLHAMLLFNCETMVMLWLMLWVMCLSVCLWNWFIVAKCLNGSSWFWVWKLPQMTSVLYWMWSEFANGNWNFP